MNKLETGLRVVTALGISLAAFIAVKNVLNIYDIRNQTRASIDRIIETGNFFETSPTDCSSYPAITAPTNSSCLSIQLRKELLDLTSTEGKRVNHLDDDYYNRAYAFNEALSQIKKTRNVTQAWSIPDPNTRNIAELALVLR